MSNTHETESMKCRGRPATGQAKTAAQRMQERRQRMKHGETGDRDKGGEREITVILTLTALNALRRMAKRDAVTQKQFLDALLRDTEDKLLKGFDDAELERYWGEVGKPAVAVNVADPQPVSALQELDSAIIDTPSPTAPAKYKGVYPHKASGKWQAQCRENGKPKALGLFDTPEEANAARLAYLDEKGAK